MGRHLVDWPLNKGPFWVVKQAIVTRLWYMEAVGERGGGGGSGGARVLTFTKVQNQREFLSPPGGVWATGVPFTGNSSAVPSVDSSVDSIPPLREKTVIKSHMTVNLIAGETQTTRRRAAGISFSEVWTSVNIFWALLTEVLSVPLARQWPPRLIIIKSVFSMGWGWWWLLKYFKYSVALSQREE